MSLTVKVMAYTVLVYSYYRSISMMCFNSINVHQQYRLQLPYKAVELLNQSYGIHITSHHATSF